MTRNANILIADDNERILQSVSAILLLQGYKIDQARNGVEVLQKVKRGSYDVILLDINMPEMDGIEVLKRLKADESTAIIPVVVLTGEADIDIRVQAIKLGADDFLLKPPHIAELTARVGSLVKVKAYNDYMKNYQKKLEEEVAERTKQLREALEKLKIASLYTIYTLSRAAEYKDEDTSLHLQRMSNYAAAVARKIGQDEDKVTAILYTSPMHDVGKIGIPDKILLKPGKLTADEWKIMKKPTLFGEQILDGVRSDFIDMAKTIALTHHEKWDGSGYPKGLKKKDIPLEGRITAIADVFDALTSKRPYKKAFPVDRAFEIIREERGTHFDPEIVDAFFEVEDEILKIKQGYQDDGNSLLFDLSQDST